MKCRDKNSLSHKFPDCRQKIPPPREPLYRNYLLDDLRLCPPLVEYLPKLSIADAKQKTAWGGLKIYSTFLPISLVNQPRASEFFLVPSKCWLI